MCMEQLIELYNIEGFSAEDTRDICSVRYNMTRKMFEYFQSLYICRRYFERYRLHHSGKLYKFGRRYY